MFEVLVLISGIVSFLGGILGWNLPLLRIAISLLMILYGLSAFPYPKADRHKTGLAVGCVLFVLMGLLSIAIASWWPLPAAVVCGFGSAFLLSRDGDNVGEPRWVTSIPPVMRLRHDSIDRLERVRRQLGVSDEEFAAYAMTHAQWSRKLFWLGYASAKRQGTDDKEVMANLLLLRAFDNSAARNAPYGIDVLSDPEKAAADAKEISDQFDSPDELIDWMVREDEQGRIPPAIEAHEAIEEIEAVLSSEARLARDSALPR